MSFQTGISTHSADKACLVCMMRPYLRLGIVTGIVGYSYSCPHLNKSVRFASFHHSPVILTIALVLAAGSVIYTAYNTWYIIHHESEWYRLPFLIYQIHACPLQLQRFWVLDRNVKEYAGLAALIENCQLYGVEYVYNKKAVKDFKLHTTIVVTSLICTLVFDTICRVIIHGVNLWVIFTQLIETLQIAEQLILATSYIATFRIYTQLKQVCYRHMRECLNGRIANVTEHDTGDIIEEHSTSLKGVENQVALKDSTITKLQKLQRMHLAIMTNFEQTTDSIDILDYLQSFPINQLNANESAQVEAIIIAVRSVRPTIHACGLFDMDLSVYCSALVVVISYFLLALQFQAAWLDE
ncbi:hypothetical protein CBL_02432 [Carabus blaptoides fortunei]